MAFQPVPNTAAVIIETVAGTFSWSNSMHFTRTLWGVPEMEALGIAVFNAWASNMASHLSSLFSTNRVTVYDLRMEGAPVSVPAVTPVVGLDPGDPYNIGDAVVVTLRTAVRGRSGRGRLYIAGFTEAYVEGGSANVSLQADVIATVSAAITAGEAAGWDYVLVQRWANHVKLANALTHSITNVVIRSAILGGQERRAARP